MPKKRKTSVVVRHKETDPYAYSGKQGWVGAGIDAIGRVMTKPSLDRLLPMTNRPAFTKDSAAMSGERQLNPRSGKLEHLVNPGHVPPKRKDAFKHPKRGPKP